METEIINLDGTSSTSAAQCPQGTRCQKVFWDEEEEQRLGRDIECATATNQEGLDRSLEDTDDAKRPLCVLACMTDRTTYVVNQWYSTIAKAEKSVDMTSLGNCFIAILC